MSETAEKIANGVTAKPRDQKKTASVSQKPTHPSPQNGNDQMFASVISSALKDPEKRVATKMHGHSRGALMLKLAKGNMYSIKTPSYSRRPKPNQERAKDVTSDISGKPQQPLPGPSRRTDCHSVKKQLVVKELKKVELKELNPEHVDYLPQDAVGGGSFGQCFRARYRGIDVVVKKMIHNNSTEDKLRAKRDLIHEAEVITSLGDHEGLPLFFGVMTAKESLCLVTQFHGIHEQSVTLQQAANASMITPSECLKTFAEICLALQHVHSRGFLHNDIKSNNVLERRRDSEKYNAILIDFGKSTKASTILPSISRRKRAHHPTKSYLAPEVLKQRRYSTVSDVYSVARMIKSVSKVMGFYDRVRVLAKTELAEEPSLRPHLDKLITEINAIQF